MLQLMTSCEINDDGKIVGLNWVGWLIVILFIGLIIAIIRKANKSTLVMKEANRLLLESGIEPQQVYYMGLYVGGHPDIDDEFSCRIYKKDDNLVLCNEVNFFPTPKSTIPIASITNIQVEDKSSIEKKVTLGRILLVGVFALGWTKKEKHEINFITIDWNDGRFSHSTTFAFYGEAGAQLANKTRNTLIKLVR